MILYINDNDNTYIYIERYTHTHTVPSIEDINEKLSSIRSTCNVVLILLVLVEKR